MLRRGSRTASSAKRKAHSCTEVAATKVAKGWTKTQWLKGCSSPLSMVDGFGKTIDTSPKVPQSQAAFTCRSQSVACPVASPRKKSRDASKGQERLYQNAYDTSCFKTAREYRKSQAWHCSSEHMIAVVALIYVNMSVSPWANAINTSLSSVWSVPTKHRVLMSYQSVASLLA